MREEISEGEASSLYFFHPCYYFKLVRVAFLKCFGLDFESDIPSIQKDIGEKKESWHETLNFDSYNYFILHLRIQSYVIVQSWLDGHNLKLIILEISILCYLNSVIKIKQLIKTWQHDCRKNLTIENSIWKITYVLFFIILTQRKFLVIVFSLVC